MWHELCMLYSRLSSKCMSLYLSVWLVCALHLFGTRDPPSRNSDGLKRQREHKKIEREGGRLRGEVVKGANTKEVKEDVFCSVITCS